MLAWLKRRARVSSISVLRRHLPGDMFVAEPVQCILTHNLKLVVVNSEGRDYSLEVPPDMTVERVKKMALGHFFNPVEAVGGEDRGAGEGGKTGGDRTYRLVLVREARPLAEMNSIQLEQLLDNDELLLVEKRPLPVVPEQPLQAVAPPTSEQIQSSTVHLPHRNTTRPAHHAHQPVDFQIEFRRILVTMIEASVRLISADPDSEDIFNQILEKLERRHRPQVDRNALKQLTEMGFPEAKATKALQVKRNVREATEWLLEQNSLEDGVGDDCLLGGLGEGGEGQTPANTMDNNDTSATATTTTQDPAERILNTFLQYRKRWFQPNPQALSHLTSMGFSEQAAIDALRASGNKLNLASNLLVGGGVVKDTQGLKRDSPIISAILASPVIQLALPKPKTLLALMMLYESPNNANMWLSDPDTHPVVSQVIRIYHAEKHSLGHPPPDATAAPKDTSDNSTTLTLSQPTMLPATATTMPTVTLPSAVFLSQGQGQPQAQFTVVPPYSQFVIMRNGSGGGVGAGSVGSISSGWLGGSSPSPLLRSSPVTVLSPSQTPPRSQPTPAPATVLRTNPEEPMSHSGSPVRRPQGTNATSLTHPFIPVSLSIMNQFGNSPSVSLEPTNTTPITLSTPASLDHLNHTTTPTPASINHLTHPTPVTLTNDIEMDESGADSLDMDTQ